MNKKTLIVAITILIAIVGGGLFFLNRDSSYQKKSFIIESDLAPIVLTQEEQQALQDEGLVISFEEDVLAKELQNVRFSDELDAIEADLNETDLSGLDAELEAIENDLSEL